MNDPKDRPTDLNNTPDVHEHLAADAPGVSEVPTPGHAACVVKEWWLLRITAGLLVPLSVWFVVALITHLLGPDSFTLDGWLASLPVTAIMVVFLASAFIHTRLGVHEIILDYVPSKCKKTALNLLTDLLCLALGIGSIAAVIHLHFMA